MFNKKTQLALSVAATAIAVSAATPAYAACSVSMTVVTCEDVNTTNDVNAAAAVVIGDDVTVNIADGAEVVQPNFTFRPNQQGAVAINNAGDVGTEAAPVDIRYIGDFMSATNSFDLSNSGTIAGLVDAFSIGGEANIDNSGLIGGLLFVSADGPVSLTSSGDIGGRVLLFSNESTSAEIDGDIGTAATATAVSALETLNVSAVTTVGVPFTPTSVTVAGVTTTTTGSGFRNEGGSALVSIGEEANTGDIFISALDEITASIDGNVGSETEDSGVDALANRADGSTRTINVVDGADSSFSRTVTRTAVGGMVEVSVGETGAVSGEVNASGLTGATVSIDGSVGTDSFNSAVIATSLSSNSEVIDSGATTGADVSSSRTVTRTSVGGMAEISVGETGTVSGQVNASGLTGATVSVDGSVGTDSFISSASATSRISNTTSENSSTTIGDVTTIETSSSFDSVGGEASISIGETGAVTGDFAAVGFAGADVVIDGTVGLVGTPSTAQAFSRGNSSTNQRENVMNAATGATSDTIRNANVSTGGDASFTINESGVLNGRIFSTADGDATVTNAGTVSGAVNAQVVGFDSSNGTDSTDDGMGNTSSSSFSIARSIGGDAVIENVAGGLIGLDATAPVNVTASGDMSGSVINAGRINGNVSSSSSNTEQARASSTVITTSTDAVTGVVTDVRREENENSFTVLGSDSDFTNAQSGLVTGTVSVSGSGSATVTNEGAVIGTTNAFSRSTDNNNSNMTVNTRVTTPGAAGGTVETVETENTTSRIDSGGDVTGIYAGTNGALQFAPFGGASDGSVNQSADGDSTALVSGSIFGNFSGDASGNEFTSSSTGNEVRVFDGDGDLRSETFNSTSSTTTEYNDNNSSLVVDGGHITGSARLFANRSTSTQIVNGGAIDGSLNSSVRATIRTDVNQTSNFEALYDEDGNFLSEVETNTESSVSEVNDSDVSLAIGEGHVGGNVFLNGAGGTNTFTLAEEGSVGGSVTQRNTTLVQGRNFTSTSSSTPTDRVLTTEETNTSTASGGDVTATVAGVIGNGDMGPQAYGDVVGAAGNSLSLLTNAGNAAATITGQVRNGISVSTVGNDGTSSSQETFTDGLRSAYSEQRTITSTGGTSSLIVDSDNLDIPANFGSVNVRGRDGATVTIGADSTVLAAINGDRMDIVSIGFDTATTREDQYVGGVLTGRTLTNSETIVGEEASLVNDGRIGYDGGEAFDGDDDFVYLFSPTLAQATNNGQIFGSITLDSLYTDFDQTIIVTDADDVTRVDTTTTTYTAMGGSAMLTNNSLVTGGAQLRAADGTAVNDGVIRGRIFLGDQIDNYTTQTVDTLSQIGEEEVTTVPDPFEQNYTVAQNGLLGNGIEVSGAFGFIEDEAGDEIRTSNITANINLNSGSVTGTGVLAEYDEETGERFTTTNVNLNGDGFLGLGDAAMETLEDSFGGIDSGLIDNGFGPMVDPFTSTSGARVLGVEALTKTGAGVFLINGFQFAPVSNINTFARYTLDVGTFAIEGGEIQLAVTGIDEVFGIRGDITNSAGLVLGTRIELPAPLFGTNATVNAIDGVEVHQNGNFNQSDSGTLTVGVTPTLVRVIDPAFDSISTSTNPLAVQTVTLNSGLFTTPENAFSQDFNELGTGFLTVDGDLTLGGTVELASPTGGLFVGGQTVDIASVSGTVTTTADVSVNSTSNFVTFGLGTRTEGGRTIVFANADRAGYETVGNNRNAVAAGTALSQAFPDVIDTIRVASAGGIGLASEQFILAQDFANIFAGFDTLLTMDQVSTAINELASGEFYGTLTALETTAPFVDAISSRRLPAGASGFNIWIAPSGDFVDFEGDSAEGSRDIEADNYGGSAGFSVATGNGEVGAGFGYGRISANSANDQLIAEADTWMFGAYARHGFGNFLVSADIIYSWSDWDATRVMPTMSRTATANFDSTELRGDLRAEYIYDFGGGWVAPFGQLAFRKFDFDGFTEEGAGAVNLVVDDADDTVFTPSLGARVGTSFKTDLATLRPELTMSYSFGDSNSSFRDVAYLGAPANSFRLQGVDPDGYFTIGAGLFADISSNSGAFIRGSYATGGSVDVASVNAGVSIAF